MNYNHFSLYNRNCHNRDFLDSCLSHALKIPLTNSRISLIDEKQYVMTLDYLVKMLNIHERRKCGIPVIINGETGVGKTFLLEMLSILWNQSMLSALDQERSSLMDILISKLQHMSELGKDGMESLLLNSPEEWFGLITCPVDKKVTTADMTEVNSVLTALKAPDSTSGKSISYDLLLHVLKLPDPHEPLSSLYRLFCSRLLKKRYDPLFSLVVFPETMQPYGSDIQSLFELASSSDHVSSSAIVSIYSQYYIDVAQACSATARLLYGLFAGQPKKTFHKLCVHAGQYYSLYYSAWATSKVPPVIQIGCITGSICITMSSIHGCIGLLTTPSGSVNKSNTSLLPVL